MGKSPPSLSPNLFRMSSASPSAPPLPLSCSPGLIKLHDHDEVALGNVCRTGDRVPQLIIGFVTR